LGMPGRVLADGKERCLDALRCECGEHCRRITWPRAIIECQYDFALLEEVMSLELLEAESRPTGRVYLHYARHSERVRIALASGNCKRSDRWRACGRRPGGLNGRPPRWRKGGA